MDHATTEEFENPSLPQDHVELSAEASQDSFNLEEEVMAMLDEDFPDLGEVELSDEMKAFDPEASGLDKVQADTEVEEAPQPPEPCKEPPPPPPPFAEDEEDFSEEYLFGSPSRQPSTTDPEVAGNPNEPEAKEGTTDTGSFEREVRREMEEGAFDARTSRYLRDGKGDLLYKWKADYAPTGRAQCKDADCLERHEQGGAKTCEKGCLRIGRRVLMDDNGPDGGHIQIMYYHARCIFNTFLRAKKSTRVIETEFDIEGFEDLTLEDRDMLRRIIDGNEAQALRNARFRTFDNQLPTRTPDKRGVSGVGGPGDEAGSSTKRRKTTPREIKKGYRVWTHFRCLPKEGADGAAAPPGVAVTVKSKNPELAMVREEVDSGTVVVQFESQEHEKERLTLFQGRRGRKIRGWLRYPRVFEGKKQRVPLDWIKWNRDPPRLCSCNVQVWGHECGQGDLTCGRNSSITVWGVAG
mmetsp:Transcript_68050/g.107944  ORF Transcript_68050/g.107944 Transcript_68050/m.107944 type:complete len:466 (+) Transcript_68050:30-1427(+)